MSRRMSVADALNAFSSTYKLTRGVMKDNAMSDVTKQQQTQDTGFTVEQGDQLSQVANAKDENGNPYYDVQATPDGKYQVTINKPAALLRGTDPAAPGLNESGSIEPGQRYTFMGALQDKPFSPDQQDVARTQAMAGVMDQFGDPVKAMELRKQAGDVGLQPLQKQAAEQSVQLGSIKLEQAKREASDQNELRGVLDSEQFMQPNAATSSGTQQGQVDVGLDGYLKNVAPRAIQTLLKHGNLEDAQKFQKFVDSDQGRTYAKNWLGGVRKLAIGDNHGAIQDFQSLYNRDLYPDGHTVQLTPSADGSSYTATQVAKDGTVLGSKTMATADLARQAALALEPTTAVKFMAEQEGKRAAESAALTKQGQMQDRQDQRTSFIQDRSDARQTRQLAALTQRQQDTGGRVTPAQEANNLEIDAARRHLSGMDAATIRKKTQPYTATGRENPDFDPQLATRVRQANQRKIGADPDFDAFNAPRQPVSTSASPDRTDVARRFRSDAGMNKYKLGKDTPNGVEVLDNAGKLVGHYR